MCKVLEDFFFQCGLFVLVCEKFLSGGVIILDPKHYATPVMRLSKLVYQEACHDFSILDFVLIGRLSNNT